MYDVLKMLTCLCNHVYVLLYDVNGHFGKLEKLFCNCIVTFFLTNINLTLCVEKLKLKNEDQEEAETKNNPLVKITTDENHCERV